MLNTKVSVTTLILAVTLTAAVTGVIFYVLQQNSLAELGYEVEKLKAESKLPADVKWLTYEDENISFVYPETFIGTSLHQDFDEDLRNKKWEIFKDENTLSIRPNFESPAAEFGATYEIKVFQNKDEAEKERIGKIQPLLGQNMAAKWKEPLQIHKNGFYVALHKKLDFGLGQLLNVYTIVPQDIDTHPNKKSVFIYASPNAYENYIEGILIPNISIKE